MRTGTPLHTGQTLSMRVFFLSNNALRRPPLVFPLKEDRDSQTCVTLRRRLYRKFHGTWPSPLSTKSTVRPNMMRFPISPRRGPCIGHNKLLRIESNVDDCEVTSNARQFVTVSAPHACEKSPCVVAKQCAQDATADRATTVDKP